MRTKTQNNMVTINVNGVEITCTQEQAIAIAAACKPAQAPSRGRKHTASTSEREAEPTPAQASRDGKVVKFDKGINPLVWKWHNALATSMGGTHASVKGCATWTFTTEKKARDFASKCHTTLTDAEYASVTARTERTDAERKAYDAAYAKAWDAYVKKCEKDGIKRTKEMNRAESARIRKELAK